MIIIEIVVPNSLGEQYEQIYIFYYRTLDVITEKCFPADLQSPEAIIRLRTRIREKLSSPGTLLIHLAIPRATK